jgi:HSP20 family protein
MSTKCKVWTTNNTVEPLSYPGSIFDEFDRITTDFWTTFPNTINPIVFDKDVGFPKIIAYEDEDLLTIQASVPYLSKEDITIDIDKEKRLIQISADAHQAENAAGRVYYLREIPRSGFKRSFTISKKFDLDKIDAELENGMLCITLPLSTEEINRYKTVTIK